MTEDPNPYRAPLSASWVAPDAVGDIASDEHALQPRISAMWAILLGQAPFYAAFALFVGAEGTFVGSAARSAFDLLSAELCIFLARSLWLGPGSARVRIPAVVMSCAAAALLPTWVVIVAAFRSLYLRSAPEFVVVQSGMTLVAVVILSVAWLWGSREAGYIRREPRIGRADIVATLFVVCLLAFSAIPALLGKVTQDPTEIASIPHDAGGGAIVRIGFLVVMASMSLTWRWGIRGIDDFRSRSGALFGLLCVVWIALVAAAMVAISRFDAPWSALIAFPIAVLVVPIGRELFIRWAGYRAINVYAKRRRARRESSS